MGEDKLISTATPTNLTCRRLSALDRFCWRLLMWGLGLATPLLSSLQPRTFAGEGDDNGGLTHLVRLGFYLFFTIFALMALMRRQNRPDQNKSQGPAATFWLLTILLAATPTLSSLLGGSQPQLSIIGITAIYSATYFLPTPPAEWWIREVRRMLLTVFVYGSLFVAVVAPTWAWNSEYDLEASVALFPMRLFGTANHANSLAPLAVFAWLLGRFPGCRLKGEYLHAMAVILVVVLAQSKTIWGIVLLLSGVYVLAQISSLSRGKRYAAYFSIASTALLWWSYLVTCTHYGRRIADAVNNPQVMTLTGRLPLWLYAMEMWLQSPWLGMGVDAWSSKIAQENVMVLGWAAPNAHNQLLQVLSQGGLAGLGLLVMWAFCYFRIARKSPGTLRPQIWWLSAAFFMPAFTEVVLQYDLGPGSSVLTWIVFALLLMMARNSMPSVSRARRRCPAQTPLSSPKGRGCSVPARSSSGPGGGLTAGRGSQG